MISSYEVFYINRYQCSCSRMAYILSLSGEVRRLPDMLTLGFPGLYHNQADNTVLAFGGGNSSKPQRYIQTYSLTKNQWEMLHEKMRHGHCHFTPCQHLSSVYLPRAGRTDLEVFSLKTLTIEGVLKFKQMCDLTLAQQPIFSYKNEIYIIFGDSCVKFNFAALKYVEEKRAKLQDCFRFGAAVIKDTLIQVNFPNYWLINLKSWKCIDRCAPEVMKMRV